MKTFLFSLLSAGLFCVPNALAQTATYTNFIRQVQYPSEVVYDASVASSGQQLSQLAIDPGGARFELWTVSSVGPTSYLLDSNYVGTYIPVATVAVRSEDTTSAIPRTRADRPFYVDLTVSGLLAGASDPEPSKSVKFFRHVQSYGAGGTGIGIDRSQATLMTQTSVTTNATQNLTFLINSVPGADRSKVRGEERFSVFSLEDYQAPESQIASKYIQIWPVADGSLTGIATNQLVRYALPQLTLTLNDLYPFSTTYVQAYKGNAALGTTGTVVAGSSLVVNDSVPQSRVLTVKDYDAAFTSDGRWTLELLTKTPFGLDRLAYVTFNLDRTMKVNGAVTTIE
ncbi:MAG: hypothetical protein ABIT37_08610 [Luteolibacter sp.]